MQPATASSYGWRWFKWVAACATVAALAPRASHLFEVNTLAIWAMMVVLWGGTAFALGWTYGKFRLRGRSER